MRKLIAYIVIIPRYVESRAGIQGPVLKNSRGKINIQGKVSDNKLCMSLQCHVLVLKIHY